MVGLVILLTFAGGACSPPAERGSQVDSTDSKEGVPQSAFKPLPERLRGGLVSVSLPIADTVVMIHADSGRRRVFRDRSVLRGPDGTLFHGDRLFVAEGPAPASVVAIGLSDGSVRDIDLPGDSAALVAIVATPSGVFVSGNRGELRDDGVLFRLDPRSLEVTGEVVVPGGQDSLAFDERSQRVWASSYLGWVSRIDARSLDKRTFRFKGSPAGIAPGPRDGAFVTSTGADRLLEMDAQGRVVGSIAVPTSPWGITELEDGRALVMAEGAPGVPGRVHLVDLHSLRVERTLSLRRRCGQPRTAAVLGDRAYVTCIRPTGILVVDLARWSFEDFLDLTDLSPGEVGFEQPRGLSVDGA